MAGKTYKKKAETADDGMTVGPAMRPGDEAPKSYDITDAIRRFKERRLRMPVHDILKLAMKLGVPNATELTYERLRKAMRMAIRDGRNG